MSFTWARLTADSLDRCRSLWPDRDCYTAAEFEQAIATTAMLLREGRAIGALVLQGDRPCGFGLSAFVRTAVVDENLARPRPLLGKRLLLDAVSGAEAPILDAAAIGAGNAVHGLDLVVVSVNYVAGTPESAGAIGMIWQAFYDLHRGYRIVRITSEVVGTAVIEVMNASGIFDVVWTYRVESPRGELDAGVYLLTRERALALRTPLLSVFMYDPPQVCFTPSEQRLLRAALDGGTDESLAESLGVSVAAVKGRWLRIQQRLERRVPAVFEPVPAARHAHKRGATVRHRITDFIRSHPSELTPYASTRSAKSVG